MTNDYTITFGKIEGRRWWQC